MDVSTPNTLAARVGAMNRPLTAAVVYDELRDILTGHKPQDGDEAKVARYIQQVFESEAVAHDGKVEETVHTIFQE
jgi:capsule polysaccharide export protein KpsC/LpsZ